MEKVLRSKSFYDLFEVEKSVELETIKKKYKKIAILVHPDRNSHPNAEKAFKRVGKAYATLSDKQKRQQYDVYSEEDASSSQLRQPSGFGPSGAYYRQRHPGFITPEEQIFRMFFGNNFSFEHDLRRRAAAQSSQRQSNRRQQYSESESQPTSLAGLFWRFLPFLVFLFLALRAVSYVETQPSWSLERSSVHPYERATSNLGVQYFVGSSLKDGGGTPSEIKELERTVEYNYAVQLERKCSSIKRTVERIDGQLQSFWGIAQRERNILEQRKSNYLHELKQLRCK